MKGTLIIAIPLLASVARAYIATPVVVLQLGVLFYHTCYMPVRTVYKFVIITLV
jgi:hypothetical protein